MVYAPRGRLRARRFGLGSVRSESLYPQRTAVLHRIVTPSTPRRAVGPHLSVPCGHSPRRTAHRSPTHVRAVCVLPRRPLASKVQSGWPVVVGEASPTALLAPCPSDPCALGHLGRLPHSAPVDAWTTNVELLNSVAHDTLGEWIGNTWNALWGCQECGIDDRSGGGAGAGCEATGRKQDGYIGVERSKIGVGERRQCSLGGKGYIQGIRDESLSQLCQWKGNWECNTI